MDKRGISPLIATVLIIGFTVALAALIFLWGGNFIKGVQEGTSSSEEKMSTCASATIEPSNVEQVAPNKMKFLLENTGQSDLKSVIVRITGNKGTDSRTKPGIGSAGKKAYEVSFTPESVGIINRLEIIPNIDVNKKSVSCAPGVMVAAQQSSYIISQLENWAATCSDIVLDDFEECNDADLNGRTCESLGYAGGTLACSNYCTFDVSGCTGGLANCGNSILDDEEQCDFDQDYNILMPEGMSCIQLGFTGGDLGCGIDCIFDTSLCTGGEAVCSNNIAEGFEECDGTDLRGNTCQTQGLVAGDLACNPECSGFDTSGCQAQQQPACGNNIKEGTEVCDGSSLGGQTCVTQGFFSGTLGCMTGCGGFDTSSCTNCGNGIKNTGEQCDGADLGINSCQTLGFVEGGTLTCKTDSSCTFDTSKCIDITGACGSFGTCAAKSNGKTYCWGYNYYGQIGDGSTADKYIPTELSSITGAIQTAQGSYHSCALKNNGEVWCWGAGSSGQLGTGAKTSSSVPIKSLMTSAKQVTTGGAHTCALKTNGEVWCWGSNMYGQIGNATAVSDTTVPVKSQISGATKVVAGATHTCAVVSTGDIYCWGYNADGELGDGTIKSRSMPTKLTTISGIAQIGAGGLFTCALKTTGDIYCWGINAVGQLGDGTTTQRLTPVKSLMTGATQITVGSSHTCAVNSAGMYCWGYNNYGQMGNGSIANTNQFPTKNSLTAPTQITAGSSHTCAVNSAGMYCWGRNDKGQLGDSTTTTRTSPVKVNF